MRGKSIALLKSLTIILYLVLGGCVVTQELPLISHTHIGHAITGFEATPKKQGLLVMAEISSVTAATNNELLSEALKKGHLSDAKQHIEEIAFAVNPAFFDSEAIDRYGLQRSVSEAITHLQLAADTLDASQNVQRMVTRANIKARQIVRNIDELSTYLDAGLKAKDTEQLNAVAEEIDALVRAIAGGEQSGSTYGLNEFRKDIEDMVASEEDPPYQTVGNFYLFDLIDLGDGEWGWKSRRRPGRPRVKYE